ncbi:MFS transporter, FHS family, Na+ dependent glucose transporter 1, partial [Schistosoma bovis]
GLYSEILGPTLPTLMYNTKSNYEQIGMALSTRGIGLLFGSLIGGLLSDRYKSLRSLFIMLSLIIGAITTLIIPWCINIILLTIILFIAGFSHGFLTTSGNPLLASVWEEKAAGPFSLMHSGYGMGAALAPLLVKPFTIPSTSANNTTTNNNHSLATNIATKQDNSTELVIVNAVIPYSIVAGIVLFCVFYFLIIMCIDHSTDPEHNGILSLTFFTIVGNERVFGKFMFTYALYGPIQLTIKDSYLINLIYWLCFCIGRILLFLLAIWIQATILLLVLCIGTLCSSIGLILLPYKKLWFYLCTILFGLFKSPLFPITLATINYSYEINGFLIIIVNFGSSFGATLLQFITGYLINQYGQLIFPYLVTSTSLLLLITSIILIFSLLHIGNRFKHLNHIRIDTINESINENNQYITTNTNTTTNNNDNDNDTSPITILPRSKVIQSKFNKQINSINNNNNNNEKL